jgi:hypothetical protein
VVRSKQASSELIVGLRPAFVRRGGGEATTATIEAAGTRAAPSSTPMVADGRIGWLASTPLWRKEIEVRWDVSSVSAQSYCVVRST